MPEMVFAKRIPFTKIRKWPRFNESVSIEAEIHYRKLLFFVRILNSEPGDQVYRLFLIRAESCFTNSLNSSGLVKNISENSSKIRSD